MWINNPSHKAAVPIVPQQPSSMKKDLIGRSTLSCLVFQLPFVTQIMSYQEAKYTQKVQDPFHPILSAHRGNQIGSIATDAIEQKATACSVRN